MKLTKDQQDVLRLIAAFCLLCLGLMIDSL